MAIGFLVTLSIFAFTSSVGYAYDPSPLQDFCVAVNDPQHAVFMNGRVCKDPKLATVDDFFASGLNGIGIYSGIPRAESVGKRGGREPHTGAQHPGAHGGSCGDWTCGSDSTAHASSFLRVHHGHAGQRLRRICGR
nr:putative germin-like protein 2-1 [Ipomoea batatas]